jgi:anti-anti-sigma factor
MIIGVDPHKTSHTATAVDPATNAPIASLRINASLVGYRELMHWVKQFPQRRWAVEGSRGLGRHLAQWLAARDEVVLDVPSTAIARVRELSRGGRRKTDVIDAGAAASVAALHGDATPVSSEDHTTTFALLEERRANLAAQRVRVANQLHAGLRDLVPGGASLAITVKSASTMLRVIRPASLCERTRKSSRRTSYAIYERSIQTARHVEEWLATFDAQPLEVDLSEVAFFDSSGLRAMLNVRRRNPHMRIVNPSKSVTNILEITDTFEYLASDRDMFP